MTLDEWIKAKQKLDNTWPTLAAGVFLLNLSMFVCLLVTPSRSFLFLTIAAWIVLATRFIGSRQRLYEQVYPDRVKPSKGRIK